MNELKFSLNGEWNLGFAPNSQVVKQNLNIINSFTLQLSGITVIPATVPGNFELDMYKAGLISDPYYSTNTLELQKLECMHLYYHKNVYFGETKGDFYLHFDGIDTVADIYANGKLIGSSDNMLTEHEFKIGELLSGYNEILVHIKPTVIEARKYQIEPVSNALEYNYDSLAIRKAGSTFGWDIMPRIVSGGLWRDVYMYQKFEERIENVFGYTTGVDNDRAVADLLFHYNLTVNGDFIHDYSVKVTGVCEESTFSASAMLWHTSGKVYVHLENAKLWFPHNYGEPNLYDVKFELFYKDQLLDEYCWKMGVRTVELDRTSTTDEEGHGQFRIIVNHKPIFAMGTNWVPVDAFHSNDVKRLPKILPMLTDLGCNIVRMWGGNVYEHPDFYDYCDEHGIMVWQDFGMGCAVYPQNKEFCDKMEKEIIQVVQKYRNHPSLCIWAGDNEGDYAYMLWGRVKRDPNKNIVTRQIIPQVLDAQDFTRPYLPSSPYIDEEAYTSGKPTSEEHCWGPRDYFKGDYYKNTVCHFASETGYHGCPSVESLKKYISPEKLWPWYDKEWGDTNEDWNVHCACMVPKGGAYNYRIPLMASQVRTLFGSEPENIGDFSVASQISQAEAKKYFIERFRFTKWRRTGIIWWNLIDGWPQISDAIVDYYYDKKLAYYYIRNSQQPLCFMADEDEKNITLYAVSDLRENVHASYTVTDVLNDKIVAQGEADCLSDTSASVATIKKKKGEKCFYLIEWKYGKHGGANHFMSGMPDISLEEYRKCLDKSGIIGIKD